MMSILVHVHIVPSQQVSKLAFKIPPIHRSYGDGTMVNPIALRMDKTL